MSTEYERGPDEDDETLDCCDRNVERCSLVYFWSSRAVLRVHIILSGAVTGIAGASYYFCYGSSTSPLTLGVTGAFAVLLSLGGLIAFPMKSKRWLTVFLYGLMLDAIGMFVSSIICFATIADAQNDLEDRWRSGVSTQVIPFTTLKDNQELVRDLLISLATIAMADVVVQLALSVWIWVQLYRFAEAKGREGVNGGRGLLGSLVAVSSTVRGSEGEVMVRYHTRAVLSISYVVFSAAVIAYAVQTYDTASLGAESGMELLLSCVVFACAILVTFPAALAFLQYPTVEAIVAKIFKCSIINVHVKRSTACASWWKPGDIAVTLLGAFIAMCGVAEIVCAVLLVGYAETSKTCVS
jgi:hypothetical protein